MAKTKGKAGRIAIWVILALLVVGLIGFGPDNFGGGAQDVASVGDRDVSAEDYGRALEAELRRVQAEAGAVTMSDLRASGRDGAILGGLLTQAALDGEADVLGLSVGDERVRDSLLEITAFQGPEGFDAERYRSALQRNRMTQPDFEADLRDEATRRLVVAAVTDGAALPPAYRDAILSYIGETRTVTYALLGEDELEEPIPTPSEDELSAWFAQNAEAFTLPETRQVAYALLRPEALVDEVEVSDEAIAELYEARSDEYVRPERRLAERLVFPDAEAAAAARARLDAGEAGFDALVEERGLSPDDVDLGDASRDDLGPAAEAVFALAEPGVVGPVETALGPALFRVNAILDASETPLEAVRDDLRRELASGVAERLVDERASEIDDLLAGGATLEELADAGLEVGAITLDPVSQDGPAADPAFREAALAAEEGDFPELRDLADGGLFALRVDAIEPPRVPELGEVRDPAVAAWRAERAEQRLTERAEAMAASMAEGEAPPVGTETVEGLRRDAPVPGAPDGFTQAAFETPQGGAAVVPGLPVAVLRVDAVEAPDPDDPRNAMISAALDAQARQGLAEDILAAYVRSIQAERGIGRDQGAINAVLSQFN